MLLRTIVLLLVLITSSSAYQLCMQTEVGSTVVKNTCKNFLDGLYVPVSYSQYYNKQNPVTWKVVNGSCELEVENEARAYVRLSGDCSVKASFPNEEGDIAFGIDEAFTIDAGNVVTIQNRRGVLLHFKRSDLINYGSEVYLFSSFKPYGVVYRSKNSSFNPNETIETYLDSKGRLDLSFENSYDNDIYYLIPQETLGKTSGKVQVQHMGVVAVIMEKKGDGVAYFDDIGKPTVVYAIYGDTFTVVAEPDEGWSYTGWTSSYCEIEKSKTDPMTFMFKSSPSLSCTITANFKHWNIYPITSTARTFKFSTDATLESEYYKLRTVFNAEEAGVYVIQAKSSKALYYIDNKNDATFSATTVSSVAQNWSKTLTMEAGSSYYLLFRQTETNGSETIQLVAKRKYSLQLDSAATGTYGTKICDPDTNYRISAKIPSGKIFDKWVVEKGTCSVASVTSATSTVKLSTDCTVKASFKNPPTLTITETPKDFNLKKDGYSSGTYYIGNMVFVPATSGTYRLNYKLSVAKYFYLYDLGEKTDFTYSNATASYSRVGEYNLYLGEVDSDGRYFVFRVADSSQIVTANVVPTRKIHLEGDAHSAASFTNLMTYDSTHIDGETLTINASTSDGYRFSYMEVTSGKCTLSDTKTRTATLTVNGNCTVKVFSVEGGGVYPISTTVSKYNYAEHRSEVGSYYGIRTVFTPEKDGVYTVKASGKKTVTIVGYNGTFTAINSNNGTSFSAKADSSYYFFVRPYSNATSYSPDNNDTLRIWVENNISVAASVSGPGTVAIDNSSILPNVKHLVGDSANLLATPDKGARFDHWEKVSGSCTIRNSNAMSTYVKLDGNCSVKAYFEESKIYKISEVPKTFHFVEDGGMIGTVMGVYTYFDIPEPGTYKLVTSSNVSVYNDFYPDETFTSSVLRNAYITSFAETGRQYIFFYCSGSYSYLTAKDSVVISVQRTYKVHVDTSGAGTVYLNRYSRNYDSTAVAGDTLKLQANPASNSKFLNWKVVSGSCTIADAKSQITSVKVNGDCNIMANFGEGSVYKITDTPVDYSFMEHYYATSPINGVRFVFDAPADGQYGIVVNFMSGYSALNYFKCNDVFGSCNSTVRVSGLFVDTLSVLKGEKQSVLVKPFYESDSMDVFSINYVDLKNTKRYSITLESDSLGSVSPSGGYTDILPNVPYSITASAKLFGYRFDHWSVESGRASFSNKDSLRSFVTVTSNATVKANFKKGSVCTIGSTEKSFTFNQDYYSDGSSRRDYEVALKWVAPDTGMYVLNIDDPGGSIYVSTCGLDSTFSTCPLTSFNNHQSLTISATKKGAVYYWTVAPYSSGNSSHSFKAFVEKASLLQVATDGHGSVSGSSKIALMVNADTIVSVLADKGYLFDKWTVVSGKANIKDSSSMMTKVSIKADAVIKANFRKGPIQKIGTTEKTFTFNKDKYSDYSSYNNTVAMTWTAPRSGWYFVEIETPANVNLSDFGSRDDFSNYLVSRQYYLKAKYAFVADSGVARYFSLKPLNDNDSTKSFSVKIISGYQLTIKLDSLMGTAKPSEKIPMLSDSDTTVSAESKVGYFFDGWSKVSGKATISDASAPSITVSVSGDATIKANFRKGPVQKIDTTFKTFAFNKDQFTDNRAHLYDVALTWTAPDSGWYYIVINSPDDDLSKVDFWNYQTSSTFSGLSSGKALPYSGLFQGAAGVPQYWSVQRYLSADSSKRFSVKIEKAGMVTVTSDGHGSVTPTEAKPANETEKINISATSKFGYKFNKWSVVSGTPVIGDSTSAFTFVTSKKDATIKAKFTEGSVQAIGKTEKSFVFADDYYTDTTGFKNVVVMSWTAPDTNWYFIEIDADDSVDVFLYNFGKTLSAKDIKKQGKNSKFYEIFKGVKDTPLYWGLGTADAKRVLTAFSAKISVPYVMTVESDSHGLTYPSGAVVMPSASDSSIMAVPYGGYQFNNWTVTKGKVDIKNPVGEQTIATPRDSLTAIKANFVMDLTTVPKLKINGVNAANHPEICSMVTVVDSNNGRSIVDMDSSDFILFEDGKPLPAKVILPTSEYGISLVFVVDESGSVSSIQDAVREYVTRFAKEMQSYDRGAIVGYVDTVRIVQNYTSDRVSLMDAIARLRFTGAYEDIAVGAYRGVELVGELLGAKGVIVFSDGMSDHKQIAASKVVSLANQFGTSIYTISFNKSSSYSVDASNYGFNILKDMSKGTGGRYYETAGIEETRDILAEIRRDLQARYMVCHTTPDTIIDGDTHLVKIDASYRGKASSDTGSWFENFLPPKVSLTDATSKLVGKTLKTDSLEIGVYVSSRISQKSVMAYIRKNGSTSSYSSFKMTQIKDSLWTMKVSPSYLVAPGVDFYVVATDSLGQTGFTPSLVPADKPYTIYVKNTPSDFELVTDGCVDTTMKTVQVSIKVVDKDGLDSVRIYYRNNVKNPYDTLKMSCPKSIDSICTALIPTSAFGGKDLKFYVESFDKVPSTTRWGEDENFTLNGCKESDVPDVKDVLEILNAENPKDDITRATKSIRLTLKSQDYTKNTDTLTVKLSCLVSGDIESDIKVVEQKSGYYETPKDIVKNETSPKRGDGKISCKALDTLVAEFKDTVYKTVTRDTVVISDEVKISYQFLKSDGRTDLDSAETSDSVKFIIRVTAPSKSLYAVDTLKLKLFTDTGDTIEVKALETGEYTMEYEYATAFYFVDDKKDLKSKRLDAVFDDEKFENRIKIQASVKGDSSSLKKRDSLIVYSDYIGADYAEIYDIDLDGSADSVRIHFVEPLEENISKIDTVFWNAGGKKWREVSKTMHLSKDRRWVGAELKKPFDYGVTAADAKNPPYLRMKKTKDSRWQKVKLLDKIGPVPAFAEKRPGRIPTADYLEMSSDIPLDTLYVKMSEPVFNKDENAWKKLFRYSKTCADTATVPLSIEGSPKVSKDSLEWRFVLKNRDLLVGNCLRTVPAAKYADSLGNITGIGGAKIGGFNSDVYIYEATPKYRLTRSSKTPKWIPPGKDKWVEVPDTLQTILIASIAPYKATVHIYDNLAHAVTDFTQTFTKEEMEMDVRGNDTDRSKIGFLRWDMRSKDGRKVGTGVYVWRIDFVFDDGHKEYRIIKTGFMRRD